MLIPFKLALYLMGVNALTFLLYGWDKRAAKRAGAARVPEYILQLLALFGGSPAALLAQQFFRHKTKKASFRLAFQMIVFLQIMALAGWWLVN